MAEAADGDGIGPGGAGPVVGDASADADLIDAVRQGDVAAYGVLYERHLGAARRAAGALGTTRTENDDLVAESFARVLRMLRAGRGPTEGFRPYLLATLRNSLISWRQRDATVRPVADVPDAVEPGQGDDPADARMHARVAADAFAALPQRWRVVLWYTEVEQCSPAEIATTLRLTPNGVAALAYRAREALRQAYLDQYVPSSPPAACRPVLEQLARWVRQKSNVPQRKQIAAHLTQCARCRDLAADLRRLNQQLPSLGPLIAGVPLAVVGLAGSAGTLATGAGVATGAGIAAGAVEAASTGLSIASWTATAKTLIAGAAIVVTTTIGPPASAPASAPPLDGIATAQTRQEHHGTGPDRAATSDTREPSGHHGGHVTRPPGQNAPTSDKAGKQAANTHTNGAQGNTSHKADNAADGASATGKKGTKKDTGKADKKAAKKVGRKTGKKVGK